MRLPQRRCYDAAGAAAGFRGVFGSLRGGGGSKWHVSVRRKVAAVWYMHSRVEMCNFDLLLPILLRHHLGRLVFSWLGISSPYPDAEPAGADLSEVLRPSY